MFGGREEDIWPVVVEEEEDIWLLVERRWPYVCQGRPDQSPDDRTRPVAVGAVTSYSRTPSYGSHRSPSYGSVQPHKMRVKLFAVARVIRALAG